MSNCNVITQKKATDLNVELQWNRSSFVYKFCSTETLTLKTSAIHQASPQKHTVSTFID